MNRRHGLGTIVVAGLILALAQPPARAQADSAAAGDTVWHETVHDVYLDGNLAAGAIVLRSADDPRLLVLRDRSDASPLLVDPESLELQRSTIDALTYGERGWEARTKAEPRAVPRGSARRIGDSALVLTFPEGFLILTDHAGTPGPTSSAELFEQVPSWRELYARHEPDADVLQVLSAVDRDVRLTLVLGTWCGDSKREVPGLLKTIEQAANSKIGLEIVALSRDFGDPGDTLRSWALTNVPTLIVSRDGEEIGRIVETPAGDSMAGDLARILERAAPLHEGRWARKERLARGRYSIRDAAGAERGVEDWELFSDADDGTLLHAWSDRQDGTTEVWHRRDSAGRSSFVEVTTTEGPWHRRSRHWIEDGALRALTRGNGTGVIRQRAVLVDRAEVVSPCLAELGRAASSAAVSQGPTTRPALLLGGAGESATGRFGTLELGHRGAEPVTSVAGTFVSTRVSGKVDGAFVEGWLHPELGVPIRWRFAGGDEVLLTQFETFETPSAEGSGAGTPP